ncbi:hypothetical protein SO802_017642 [Lithocarpus litseifolius]|uniref:Zinc finger GRF-type domain-containing protein n=1 Tax=Lithocarpus litseifolius TaxID=425828 RepID=A0AAW2CLJ2_9ROSI
MSSSSYYSGSSHHSYSADRCQLRTALILNNFGRGFYGCCYYNVDNEPSFKYFRWLDGKTCKRGSEVAPIVLARISIYKNEARVAQEKENEASDREKVATEREILARAMEEESRGRKKVVKQREEEARVRERIAKEKLQNYKFALVSRNGRI